MLVRLHSGESGSWSDAALELTTTVIPLLEQQEAHAELGKAWRLVAMVQQIAGRLGEASETISKVIQHARLAGDERLVARSALGMTLSAVYGPTPAVAAIAQCEALIATGMADRQVQNLIICKIALLHAMVGDYETARRKATSARSVLRDLGPGVRAAVSSIDVAVVELLAGDPVAAERELRPDCEMLERLGETFFLSTMVTTLAQALLEQGRDEEAMALTKTAETSAAADDLEAQADWRCVRALVLGRRGELAESSNSAVSESTLSALATVLSRAGRTEEARRALADAIAIYTAKGDLSSLGRAEKLLLTIQ